jgi:hypothetical protein
MSALVSPISWKTSTMNFSAPTQARGRLIPCSASQSSWSSQSSQDQYAPVYENVTGAAVQYAYQDAIKKKGGDISPVLK